LNEADTEHSLTAEQSARPRTPGRAGSEMTKRTARAASLTGVRQGLGMGLAAVTAAVVARVLGAANYGYYAGGMAAFQFALSFSELGFGLVLTREMASHPAERGSLMRSAVQVDLIWSTMVAAALVGVALATGVGPRGEVMLVMAPAVVVSGLGPVRQVFLVTFTVGRLFVVDVLTAILQAAAMVTAAALRAGLVAIAGASAVSMIVNQVVNSRRGWYLVNLAPATRKQRRRITRMALPLGIASIIASLYFTIDQVILTWLVPAADLGHYAAAVKLLTVVVTIPGFIMQAGIPALAQSRDDRLELSHVAGRLTHWIVATALPLSIGLAVFAKPAIEIAFGHAFLPAVPLLRILMLAGTLSLAANVLGVVLSSLSIVRPQLIFNVATLAVNVSGNILLVPRYGVAASAWLTAGCEAIVVSYALVVLRHRVYLSKILAPSLRALLAAVCAGGAGFVLSAHPLVGVPASAALFVSLILTLGAWPDDLTPERFRRA
jgi:O-antigen/teichoic acid export membrane protein